MHIFIDIILHFIMTLQNYSIQTYYRLILQTYRLITILQDRQYFQTILQTYRIADFTDKLVTRNMYIEKLISTKIPNYFRFHENSYCKLELQNGRVFRNYFENTKKFIDFVLLTPRRKYRKVVYGFRLDLELRKT